MMFERYAEIVGALLTVLAPLVGVPLTVITFYLRALKEQLRGAQADLSRRMESLEQAAAELRREWRIAERDFATKEEWLREVLQSRRQMEQLAADIMRLQLRSAMPPGRDGADAAEKLEVAGGWSKEETSHGQRTQCA